MMSTEERLDRLGLRHLADKPKELLKELNRRIAEIRKEERKWEKQRRKRKDQGKNIPG